MWSQPPTVRPDSETLLLGVGSVTIAAMETQTGSSGNLRSACRNCGTPLAGPYCSACGQRVLDLDRPLRDLVGEWASAVAAFDTRLVRTVWPLFRRPGFLTAEFLAGRRVRYVHPLKLYLAISLVAFLVLSLSGRSLVAVSAPEADTAAPVRVIVSENTEGDAPSGTDGPLFARALLHVVELYETGPAAFNRAFTHHLARSVFVLVPVLAIFLRLLYRRTPYVHHLVATLHLQSFAFVAILAALVVDATVGGRDGPGGSLAAVAMTVWAFVALRRLHGESRLRTLGKTAALALGSLIALIAVMLATVLVTTLLA